MDSTKTPEDAASELWPVIVGGKFSDVVEAFRKRDELWRAAVFAEREACAKLAEEQPAPLGWGGGPADVAAQIADAIRARK